MADDDKTPKVEQQGYPPLALQANSYDFQALHAAVTHATGLKVEEHTTDRLATISTDLALDQDRLTAASGVPEGHVMGEIEDAQGRLVKAPVLADSEAAPKGEEATPPTPPPPPAQTGRRGGGADADTAES